MNPNRNCSIGIHARPHPGPLPRGEGESYPALDFVQRLVIFPAASIGGSLPMNLVAAGILPAVELGLPARRKWLGKIPNSPPTATVFPGGKMPALYGRQDARRYGSGAYCAQKNRGSLTLAFSANRKVGLGVLTPPLPSGVSSMLGGSAAGVGLAAGHSQESSVRSAMFIVIARPRLPSPVGAKCSLSIALRWSLSVFGNPKL